LAGQRSKPLHLRTNDILSAKKERQKLLKDQLHMEKELKDPTSNHKPNLEWTQNRSFSSAKKHRNPTEFLKDIESWYQKRNEKIQASQIKILKDDFEKMPFHPKINKKWKNLTVFYFIFF
jgi:predicted GTPase